MSEEALVDGGRVDTITADGSVLWLAMEGVVTRRLIEKMPEVDVLVATETNMAWSGASTRLGPLNSGP